MLLFVVFVVAAFLLYFADEYARGLFGPGVHVPYVGQAGLYFSASGLLAFLALFIPFRDPAPDARCVVGLIGLLATVWTLVGMAALYDHALTASRIAIWAAVIVLVAIAWDVVMSGESMTNEGTRRIPRATRVLAFLGYVILVAATVLFYAARQVSGPARPPSRRSSPRRSPQRAVPRRVPAGRADVPAAVRARRPRQVDPAATQEEPGPVAVRGWASSHSDSDV